jgi:UDP-N-acetyl-D-glucosamine dehydrogenase
MKPVRTGPKARRRPANPLDVLRRKILDRSARIGVVGLGYVGLPFAVEKAKVGFSVVGIDQNPERAANVNNGISHIEDVPSNELAPLVRKGLIRAQTGFEGTETLDVIVICVPTPLSRNLAPDLQHVEKVTSAVAPFLRRGQLISLESTTYPGTTEELMKPILDKRGLKMDEEYFLAHSPERVDPGNKRYTTKNTTKVVGGAGPNSLEIACLFYAQTISTVVPVSSARAAELVKVFENTFRAVNIALVNELALLCDRLKLDVWEVLDAAFTKPFGIMPFYPGPGVGGHCIPLDPHYLEWKAKEVNFNTRFIALAGEINRRMPEFVVEKAFRILNKLGKAPSRSRVLLLGIAYKKNLGDARESPALEVLRLLRLEGVRVEFHDPYVASVTSEGQVIRSRPLSPREVKRADLVIVTTDHSAVDYAMVGRHASHVFDTRNAMKGVRERKKVTRL